MKELTPEIVNKVIKRIEVHSPEKTFTQLREDRHHLHRYRVLSQGRRTGAFTPHKGGAEKPANPASAFRIKSGAAPFLRDCATSYILYCLMNTGQNLSVFLFIRLTNSSANGIITLHDIS